MSGELKLPGCTNHGCIMRDGDAPGSLHTNAICKCAETLCREGKSRDLERRIRSLKQRNDLLESGMLRAEELLSAWLEMSNEEVTLKGTTDIILRARNLLLEHHT